ncbi:hypothetical protein DSECCO2_612660 [anaerobic digester metagenome]
MMLRKDAITRLMNQYRTQLPAQESFENKRKMMLEYIALYYDSNRDPQPLVMRLHYLKQGRSTAHGILAALAGGAISCAVMMLCSGHFSPCRVLLSCAVCLLLTAALAYAAYGAILLGIRYFADADPYFTDEYEAGRIRDILGEAVDEIAQIRLRL